jgi:phosphoribosylaminoimidazole-succinocarboxamide synthase
MTQISPAARPVMSTNLSLPLVRRGKVRDVYSLGTDKLLIVASDRISAFDVVMPTPIAGKGALLNAMAVFWLRFVERLGICTTHLLSTSAADVPASAFIPGGTTRADLEGRVMIGKACRVIPIECVVRGYLEGSGWKEYQATGSVCGVPLPKGLRQCDKLPAPIFTPATKEEQGKHDENISFERAAQLVGEPLMARLRAMSLAIYQAASDHARARGIIIADTKFEFGIPHADPLDGSGSDPILIDEALTPDSSRFWPADTYAPGRAQKSYDKQFLREYLETLVASGAWNKQAPGPELPPEIVRGTFTKYEHALTLLTGPNPS